jgi:hypothetical protein
MVSLIVGQYQSLFPRMLKKQRSGRTLPAAAAQFKQSALAACWAERDGREEGAKCGT